MKKITKLLMLAVVALGVTFTACNNNDLPEGPDVDAKNSYTSVTLKLSQGITKDPSRATSDDEEYNYVGEWVGADVIESVAVFVVGDDISTGLYELGDFTTATSGTNINLIPKKGIKTSPGQKEVYILINGTTEVVAHLAAAAPAAFKTAYTEAALKLANEGNKVNGEVSISASKLAETKLVAENAGDTPENKDFIVMTNTETVTIDVVAGVTEAQTLDATSPQNRAAVDVERTVARVLVTIAETPANGFEIKTTAGTLLGKVNGITWVLAQGENSLYVQRKTTWQTPEFGWIPSALGNDYETKAGSKYDYSGLFNNYVAEPGFGGIAINTLADYADATAGSIGVESVSKGEFVLPNTHAYGAATMVEGAYTGGYNKGNTVYAMVRAKFTPEADAIADGGTLNADGTFYLGANNKIYSSAANAVNPATNGVKGQTVAKYVGGKMIYYAWANPDDVAKPFNSPVLRNNIYHIHVTGFKTLGTNWNPLFPEDPTRELEDPTQPYDPIDNPYKDKENPDPNPTPELVPNPDFDPNNPDDPDNPEELPTEEPENPIDPEDPLTTPETWMSVQVKTLPWKVHTYDVDLGI